MKLLLIGILTIFSSVATCDEVLKWIDDKGKIHYCNVPPETHDDSVKNIPILETFDQKEYERANLRRKENERAQQEIDRWRKAEADQKKRQEEEQEIGEGESVHRRISDFGFRISD